VLPGLSAPRLLGRRSGRAPRRPHRSAHRFLALALLLALPARPDDRALEHEVKAVFLERFARFVEWPEGALGTAADPFRIEVLGDDPFDGLLEKAYADRLIRQRRVQVRHASRVDGLGTCHLLFVSGSMAPRLREVLARLRGRPVLLVGDTPGYGEAGVHLNFYLEQGKVRFELNQGALRESGLSASYLLQQVATSVQTRGGRP
jgi:hypothetical protein